MTFSLSKNTEAVKFIILEISLIFAAVFTVPSSFAITIVIFKISFIGI